MISSASPTVTVAMTAGPAVLLPLALFGGLLINTDSIPVYLRWITYISFMHYGLEAIADSQFKDTTIGCDPGELCQIKSELSCVFLRESLRVGVS